MSYDSYQDEQLPNQPGPAPVEHQGEHNEAEAYYGNNFCDFHFTLECAFRKQKGSKEKCLVGPARFELTTSCTPSKRATRLRYGPNP